MHRTALTARKESCVIGVFGGRKLRGRWWNLLTGYSRRLTTVTLCYTPAHTSIRRCLKSFTFCLLLGYAPDFVVHWIEVMVVRRHTNLARWMHSQLLRMVSLQALQTKMAVHDICPHISISGVVSSRFVAGLRGRVSAPPPKPYFLQCMPG